jgi:hypothetical protein
MRIIKKKETDFRVFAKSEEKSRRKKLKNHYRVNMRQLKRAIDVNQSIQKNTLQFSQGDKYKLQNIRSLSSFKHKFIWS